MRTHACVNRNRMSSSLTEISTQLSKILYPIMIVIGVLGNSLNIATLTRPSLYFHACSRYFLALAGNNLFYSSILFTFQLLSNGYQMNPSNTSRNACKIISYISTISAFLSPYFIVCASIDRYCSSSLRASVRRLSNVRTAKAMICFIILIFTLFFIHILVLSDLRADREHTCITQANSVYSQIYIIVQVCCFAIVPPCLMILFGFLSIKNSLGTHVVRVAASRYKRTERQLTRMLSIQIGMHILFTLPTSVTYLISTLPNTIRTTPTYSFVATIAQFLFDCSYITSFFLYFLTGRIYRKELIRLLRKIWKHSSANQVMPSQELKSHVPGRTTLNAQTIV